MNFDDEQKRFILLLAERIYGLVEIISRTAERKEARTMDRPSPTPKCPTATTGRRLSIRIYFRDSPTPLDLSDVCHIGTEGGLLRVITGGGIEAGGSCQWWPLCGVFNIRLLSQTESKG